MTYENRSRILVAHLQESQLHQIAGKLEDKLQRRDLRETWLRVNDMVRARVLPAPEEILQNLSPDVFEKALKFVQTTHRFAETYGASRFQIFDLHHVVALQAVINLRSVQLFKTDLPSERNLSNLFEYCTRSHAVHDPLQGEGGEFVFSSRHVGEPVTSIPTFRRIDRTSVEVVIRVTGRPNILQACIVGGRVILTNGHHRAVALLREGIRYAVGLVYEDTFNSTYFENKAEYFPLQYLAGLTPPLLIDYLDGNADLFHDITVAERQQILRLGYTALSIQAPTI